MVVDEADRMLDMGFEPDLRQIFLQEDLPDRSVRQSLMFSATFPSHVQKIARAFLRSDHAHVTVGTVCFLKCHSYLLSKDWDGQLEH